MLIQALREKSPRRRLRPASPRRWALYLAFGLGICSIPGAVPVLFLEPTFQGRERGHFALLGSSWRWSGGFFGLAGVRVLEHSSLPRSSLALSFRPRWCSWRQRESLPHFMYTMAALDPALALIAWRRMNHR